ncbi:MAG: hypothetical protein OEZ06_17025 [Myxococcales bacterium]|nr:hypothetical protein [Myxococcales bacterium]
MRAVQIFGLCVLGAVLSACSFINDFDRFEFEATEDGGSGNPNQGGSGGGGGSGGSGGSGGAAPEPDAGSDADVSTPADGGGGTMDSGGGDTGDASVDSGSVGDPLCDAANCDEVASCDSSSGTAKCTCPQGYYDFNADGSECVDLDECKAGVHNCDDDATCENTQGGFECNCNAGFIWDASASDCVDGCLVLLSTTCDPVVGLCIKPSGDAVCRCPAGYVDVNGDGTLCEAAPACLDRGCDPLAECDPEAASPECICPAGFTGDGTACDDVDECTEGTDDCHVQASCTNTEGGYVCTCNDGYDGDGVTCADVDECTAGTDGCSDNATCGNTVGSYDCSCKDGFSGDGFGCTDDDECELGTADCSSNANCTNEPGGYSCKCKSGYEGNGTTCSDVDECTAGTADCVTGEKCTNTPGSFTCGCDAGYKKNASGSCVDVNECTENLDNCSTSATCTNSAGGFDCKCNGGYEGDGVECVDINECTTDAHDCSANGNCTNTAGGFTCTCKTGYEGNGKTCTDIDECTKGTDNCHDTRANCIDTDGSFKCNCKTGYEGDGVTCTNINECALGKDDCDTMPDACVDSVGSYSCKCPGGYTGEGVGADGCVDIDECKLNTDNCDDAPDACINRPGSFVCECPAPSSGDGIGPFGCCTADAFTDLTRPSDGLDNECDGLWDRPVINWEKTFPSRGGASSAADVAIYVEPTVIAGGTLYCRSYKRSGTAPTWSTCPNPIVNTANSGSAANDGAWRTDFRWRYDDGRIGHSISFDYYIHHSLHLAPRCPELAATDEAIFEAAQKHLDASLSGSYKDPGPFAIGENTFLANPFVVVGYRPVVDGSFWLMRKEVPHVANNDYMAEMWSLRKRFVASPDGRYVLLRRTYVAKRKYSTEGVKSCKVARFEQSVSNFRPPPNATTGFGYYYGDLYDCDAVVVNRAGAGVCINAPTAAPAVFPLHYEYAMTLPGYGNSNKYMWRALIDERGWHGVFKAFDFPNPPVPGYRNFSEKCATAGCNSGYPYMEYLPDMAILRP